MANGNLPFTYKSSFELEEAALDFWRKKDIFSKSLSATKDKKPFSFYDGPPFITGMPHYATLLPSIAKDIVPRFQTMRGRYVRRRWGWDVHGLPAETQVEKKLGLKSKRDIEKLGVERFIAACKEYVSAGRQEWRWYIDHIGRWADLDNSYRTDQLSYMETVIWLFKQLYDKGLIYRGSRTSLYCTRCATPLSKFEVTMDEGSYKDVEDPGVTIAFELEGRKNTFVLAWTTTPWTLPANTALAVDKELEYQAISDGEKTYYLAALARERYPEFAKWEVVETIKGQDMVGWRYRPLYQIEMLEKVTEDFRVLVADFISVEEGTGVVHIAPAYGEEDANFGKQNSLSAPLTIDDEGRFKPEIGDFLWTRMFYKEADPLIEEDLHQRGLLVKKETIIHSYPHCYRCDTPLIYKAQEAWYLKLEPLRKKLLENNKQINWVPAHFGKKRFAYNIETAPDWCISRTRYWATPVPVWQTDEGELIVPGSIKEIEEMSGEKISDLHRPLIDEVVLKTKDGKTAHRVKEVLDCWFESAAMPYAQDHYPFENMEEFEQHFPADFIVEYTGQLRGWFYYLHVLANALLEKNSFKNVAVTGVLMGTDGRKMSKSYGNYPDPRQTIEKYGAEALRLYFMSSKIMAGEDLSISESEIQENSRLLGILRNCVSYYLTYRDLGKKAEVVNEAGERLDQWIRARVTELIGEVSGGIETLDFVRATKSIRPFVEDLSTWYIRRSRERFVAGDERAIKTLGEVLRKFALAVAPILPFSAEAIFQALRDKKDEQSVHLCSYPKSRSLNKEETALLKKMESLRELASVTHFLRADKQIPLRQPLEEIELAEETIGELAFDEALLDVLRDEANVYNVKLIKKGERDISTWTHTPYGSIQLNTRLTEELLQEGKYRELMRLLQSGRKKSGLQVGEKVAMEYRASEDWGDIIEARRDELKKTVGLIEITRVSTGGDLIDVVRGELSVRFIKRRGS